MAELDKPGRDVVMNAIAVMNALQKQVDCYRRLLRLAELQHLHVEQNQTEALLEVLKSRQELLDQIGGLEQTVAPAKRSWSEYLDLITTDDREKADLLLSETRRLLEQITAADRNDVLVLQQRKLNLGRQIRQAQAARSLNRTYGTSAYGPEKSNMDVQR